MEAPDVEWQKEEWFEDHGVGGFAAFFDKASESTRSTIYFNEESVRFLNLVNAVKSKMSDSVPQLMADTIVREEVKKTCYLAVGINVVAGLSQISPDRDEAQVVASLNPMALTTVVSTLKAGPYFNEMVRKAKSVATRRMTTIEAAA